MAVKIFLWATARAKAHKKLKRTAGNCFKKNLESGTNLSEKFQFTYTYSKVK
jgi:hypothetical protein